MQVALSPPFVLLVVLVANTFAIVMRNRPEYLEALRRTAAGRARDRRDAAHGLDDGAQLECVVAERRALGFAFGSGAGRCRRQGGGNGQAWLDETLANARRGELAIPAAATCTVEITVNGAHVVTGFAIAAAPSRPIAQGICCVSAGSKQGWSSKIDAAAKEKAAAR